LFQSKAVCNNGKTEPFRRIMTDASACLDACLCFSNSSVQMFYQPDCILNHPPIYPHPFIQLSGFTTLRPQICGSVWQDALTARIAFLEQLLFRKHTAKNGMSCVGLASNNKYDRASTSRSANDM